MVCSVLAFALLQPAYQADRFSLGLRLRRLEQAWMTATKEKKLEAVPKVSGAVMSFFGGQTQRACQALDEGLRALGEPTTPLDFRITPLYGGPDEPANLHITWAYPGDPVQISVQGNTVNLDSGVSHRLALSSLTARKGTVETPVKVGTLETRVRAGRSELILAAISRKSPSPLDELLQAWNVPDIRPEADLLDDLDAMLRSESSEMRYAKQGSTPLRAYLPAGAKTLLIALHGAGGSEHMMFEAYGAGAIVQEAKKRKWAVVSPRTSRTAIKDSIDWFTHQAGTPDRILLLGHSAGGATILAEAARMERKPNAVALFAPAGGALPDALKDVPTFVAVGKYEIPGLRQMAGRLGATQGVEFLEVETSEHLMIVADAYPQAFDFFDRALKR